jgi:1-acyl-sn-glycerol-3-phosphate acyltransferase
LADAGQPDAGDPIASGTIRHRGRHEGHVVRDWVYRPVVRCALLLFRILGFRFTVVGDEHVPAAGGAVLASNHVSYFDFMFVGLAAHPKRRLVRFMAKKAVFDHPIAGPLMRGMHHIPVDRAAGAGAFQLAVRALASGELVGVFPEQTISSSYELRPIKSGAARLAMDAGVPLVPIVVWGGQRVWTARRRPTWRRGVAVTVTAGPPIAVAPGMTAAELTDRLAETLRTMVAAAQRAYPDPAAPGDDWWQPASLGGTAPTVDEAAVIEAAAIAGRLAKKAKKAEKAQRKAS